MLLTIANPTFVAYVITSIALLLLMLFLWLYSGSVRSKSKTTVNTEDGAAFKATVVEQDPPAVARVLRAHINAEANIYPFLFLGLLFVALGGSLRMGEIVFGVFVLARLMHAITYLRGSQPWRTIFFIIGGLATGALLVDIVILLLRST